MASVIFGLYENKDDRPPYALFVVGIDKGKIYVFSSEEHIGSNKMTIPYREWVGKDSKDISQWSNLRYEPYIAEYEPCDSGQRYNDEFFNGLLEIEKMELQGFWPSHKDSVYIMLYKFSHFENDHLPDLMLFACERILSTWREYFISYNKDLPHININKIIEAFHDFEGMAPFFEAVTEISSLFYEKARSKGSITVMDSDKDPHMIKLKTDAEDLSFSVKQAKQLRKLLETTKNDLSLIVYDRKICGIGRPDPDKTLYTFNLTGHREWHVLDHRGNAKKGVQVLRYKHGEYYLPTDNEVRSWRIGAKIKDDAVCKMVHVFLSEEGMKEFEHGALIIITNEAETEVERLCKLRRGLNIEQVDISSKIEEIGALCAIDGALFLNKDGYCCGIGIILDGEAATEGTPARGSRYNSAKTYIYRCVQNKIEAYALVVSSDGYFDILTTNDEEFKYKEPGIEGMADESKTP
jgi:hypothetical protein